MTDQSPPTLPFPDAPPPSPIRPCPNCKGTGRVTVSDRHQRIVSWLCQHCAGTGSRKEAG